MGKTDTPYYPVMLNLLGQRCVVVGGGRVAERKISGLLAAQANVVVVSPRVTARIVQWMDEGVMSGVLREYAPGDLAGAFLVFAATDDGRLNERVVADARQLGIAVNAASSPAVSTFVNPSTIRRGKLVLAVSTSGASPELAKKIGEQLEAQYGDEYEVYLDFLHQFRLVVQARVPEAALRHRMMERMLRADWLGQMRQGTFRPWSEAAMVRWIEQQWAENEAFDQESIEGANDI